MLKKDGAFSVEDSYQELDFKVVHRAAGNFRYADTEF